MKNWKTLAYFVCAWSLGLWSQMTDSAVAANGPKRADGSPVVQAQVTPEIVPLLEDALARFRALAQKSDPFLSEAVERHREQLLLALKSKRRVPCCNPEPPTTQPQPPQREVAPPAPPYEEPREVASDDKKPAAEMPQAKGDLEQEAPLSPSPSDERPVVARTETAALDAVFSVFRDQMRSALKSTGWWVDPTETLALKREVEELRQQVNELSAELEKTRQPMPVAASEK